MSIASVMKRQNKMPLNFIVPSNKKRCKDSVFEVDGADVDVQQLSSHTVRNERLSQKWTELRSTIYETMITRQALPMKHNAMYVEN